MKNIVIGIILLAMYSSATFATSASGAKVDFKKGEEVFYKWEKRKIDFVDGNGNVILNSKMFGQQKEFATVDDIEKVKTCQGKKYCKGHRVLYSDTVFRIMFAYGEEGLALKNIDGSRNYKKYLRVDQVYRIYDKKGDYEFLTNVLNGKNFRKVEFLYEKKTDAGNTETWVALKKTNDYYRSFAPIDEISKIKKCYKRICRRDQVLYNGAIRVVEVVDNTGRVVLKKDNDHDQSFTTNREVSMYKKCKGLCKLFGPISPAYSTGDGSGWDENNNYD